MIPTNTNADIRDVKGLVDLPASYGWLWVLLVIVVLVVAAWLVYRWLRKRRQAAPPIVRVQLTPYEIAVQSLKRLLDEKLMERGEVDAFYTQLSDIVRHYLEGRFQLHAPERTTEEFLYEVAKDKALTQEHKDLLGNFLQECDLVKFAKFRPASADMQRAFDAAEKFVNDTRPRLREEAGTAPSA